jgi:hypothetical protein
LTFDSNAHHGWGLPNEPQRRFPRDDPDPKAHGPVTAARATEAIRVEAGTKHGLVDDPHDVSGPDERTSIAARIEPELRAIVDQAVERVAVLEVEAVREVRDHAQESKRREQEALEEVLERLAGLLDGLDLLAESVSGVASSMRQELEGLNGVVTELTRASSTLEADARDSEPVVEEVSELPPEPEWEPASDRVTEDAGSEPWDGDDAVSGTAAYNGNAQETEPPPEITRMFRRQMENMWRAGTSRADAERWLMRFELGDHHRDLLDEIYSAARIQPKRRKGLFGRLRGR